MKNYLKILLLAVMAFSAVSCDEHIKGGDPDSRPKPPPIVYDEVLSVSLNKIIQANPVFGTPGFFAVNLVFPNKYYDTFEKTNSFSSVGAITLRNYGDKKLMIGRGTGGDSEWHTIPFLDLKPGDGVNESADAHYYYLGFTSQVGTFDVRLEFDSLKSGHWCTPKFRVVIGKDSEGLWTVNIQSLTE